MLSNMHALYKEKLLSVLTVHEMNS